MKNRNLIQSLKVTILGILVGVGFSYAFAQWTPPTGSPSAANNAAAPINVSNTPQLKGSGTVTPGALLDIRGTLSANSLAVWGNTIFNGNVTVSSFSPSSNTRAVCVDTNGKLIICN